MKGLVTLEANERLEIPSVNATISRFYKPGDIVNVVESVVGDEYDSEDVWYKLDSGAYLWSGAVDVELDCKLKGEDQHQFLITYRKVDGNKPDVNSKSSPDELYFTPVRIPYNGEVVRVNKLETELFVNGVMQSISKLDTERRHVMVYIHGWQIMASLKLDLFSHFVQNYMTIPGNGFAKMMFLSWPAHGNRHKVDDRSIEAGQHFTAKNLFAPFKRLSEELRKKRMTLNLVVHSFGHQLLNGMINPLPPNLKGTFDNIFLMAADVTHLAATTKGAELENFYGYGNLNQLGNKVHVFYNKYDYLLYISSKKFFDLKAYKQARTPAERLAVTENYRNLGNYGFDKLPGNQLQFNFIDVDQLIDEGDPGDPLFYPIKKLKGSSTGRQIDQVWNDADYAGVNGGRVFFRASKIPNHHRYLFTCRPVVEKVREILG